METNWMMLTVSTTDERRAVSMGNDTFTVYYLVNDKIVMGHHDAQTIVTDSFFVSAECGGREGEAQRAKLIIHIQLNPTVWIDRCTELKNLHFIFQLLWVSSHIPSRLGGGGARREPVISKALCRILSLLIGTYLVVDGSLVTEVEMILWNSLVLCPHTFASTPQCFVSLFSLHISIGTPATRCRFCCEVPNFPK